MWENERDFGYNLDPKESEIALNRQFSWTVLKSTANMSVINDMNGTLKLQHQCEMRFFERCYITDDQQHCSSQGSDSVSDTVVDTEIIEVKS